MNGDGQQQNQQASPSPVLKKQQRGICSHIDRRSLPQSVQLVVEQARDGNIQQDVYEYAAVFYAFEQKIEEKEIQAVKNIEKGLSADSDAVEQPDDKCKSYFAAQFKLSQISLEYSHIGAVVGSYIILTAAYDKPYGKQRQQQNKKTRIRDSAPLDSPVDAVGPNQGKKQIAEKDHALRWLALEQIAARLIGAQDEMCRFVPEISLRPFIQPASGPMPAAGKVVYGI